VVNPYEGYGALEKTRARMSIAESRYMRQMPKLSWKGIYLVKDFGGSVVLINMENGGVGHGNFCVRCL